MALEDTTNQPADTTPAAATPIGEAPDVDMSIDMDKAQAEISESLFGPKEGDVPGEDKPVVEAKAPVAATTEPAPVAVPPAKSPLETPPDTWRKDTQAHWAALPEPVRAEIHKRESDMHRGMETYKTAASVGQGLHKVLEPYIPVMQQYNIDPMQQIGGLMQAHYTLAMGSPEQKVQVFQKLAADYGIDITDDGFRASSLNDNPQVSALLSKIAGLESSVNTLRNGKVEEVRQATSKQIADFANNPANTYFDEVSDAMADLINSNQARDLAEAYEKAVWLNPVTRAKEVARQAKTKAEADAKVASEHAVKAKRAAAATIRSSTSSAIAPGGAAKLDSLDDTLREQLAVIRARDS